MRILSAATQRAAVNHSGGREDRRQLARNWASQSDNSNSLAASF